MRLGYLASLSLLLTQALAAPTRRDNDTDYQSIVENAQSAYEANTIAMLQSSNSSCNLKTVLVRRAWDDMSTVDRLNYIDAVKCLEDKPARTPPELAPGARNWRDDFVYAHINQTNFAHVSGLLLPWHRQFVWAYEQSLRNECGYTGALPYWAWERHSANQSDSPVWKPGPTSFGGNGAYIPHGPTNASVLDVEPPFYLYRSPGTGGGCISSGPFANSTITLGPVTPEPNPIPNNTYGLQSNPRCLKRDLDDALSATSLTYKVIADLMQTSTIHDFHPLLENTAHPSSHNYMGGDGGDFYTSPNDPVFYLIHAQIDRLWTVWQGQDYASRQYALDGTLTIANRPPSGNATLESVMKMGIPAGGDVPIGAVMNAIAGEYCYVYA